VPIDKKKIAAYRAGIAAKRKRLTSRQREDNRRLWQAISSGRLEAAKMAARSGDIFAAGLISEEGFLPCEVDLPVEAVREGIEFARWLCKECHVSPNHISQVGQVTLLNAARDAKTIGYLLDRGASLNPYGEHAAVYACVADDGLGTVDIILERTFAPALAASDPNMVRRIADEILGNSRELLAWEPDISAAVEKAYDAARRKRRRLAMQARPLAVQRPRTRSPQI
jgi:hypothetical protein